MLKKEIVRDGEGRIVGTVTTGYSGSYEVVVRDDNGKLLGTTSSRFSTTRDENGGLLSNNTADAGLLIRRK
jgi:hypothetical protein